MIQMNRSEGMNLNSFGQHCSSLIINHFEKKSGICYSTVVHVLVETFDFQTATSMS